MWGQLAAAQWPSWFTIVLATSFKQLWLRYLQWVSKQEWNHWLYGRLYVKGAQGRRGTFEGLAEHLLPGNFDPPDFALNLARKDVDLAVSVGREYDVPMRLANLALMEMTEAINRGWGGRDSRVAMLLQEERAGVEVRADETAIKAILDAEKNG